MALRESGAQSQEMGLGSGLCLQSHDESRRKQLTLGSGHQTEHQAGLAGKGEEAAERSGLGWGYWGGWTLPRGSLRSNLSGNIKEPLRGGHKIKMKDKKGER